MEQVGSTQSTKPFHAFQRAISNQTSAADRSLQSRNASASFHLRSMDEFLREKVSLLDRKEYRKAPETTLKAIRIHLANEDKNLTQDTGEGPAINQKIFEHHLNIMNSAERLFSIFLPLVFEGPCVQKFWGAIYRILKVSVLNLKKDII